MTQLRVLQDEVQACRRCTHGLTRTQIVFAKGDPLSPLCFVGEAPGEEEDAQGIPFVGDSGKLLDKQIAAMREYAATQGIAFPADPYVCNVLKCRPPGNKLLKDGSDVFACAEHLWHQLRLLPNLRVIVALGRIAAQTLLGSDLAIGKLRGTTYAHYDLAQPVVLGLEARSVFTIATYHPAYLLRQPNNKELSKEVWADLKRAVEALR